MSQDKQNVLTALHGEQRLLVKYAELLGVCSDEKLRNKLLSAESQCNSSAAFILDELSSRGWIKEIPADNSAINAVLAQNL